MTQHRDTGPAIMTNMARIDENSVTGEQKQLGFYYSDKLWSNKQNQLNIYIVIVNNSFDFLVG